MVLEEQQEQKAYPAAFRKTDDHNSFEKHISKHTEEEKNNLFKCLLENRNPLTITKYIEITYSSGHASSERSENSEAGNMRRSLE